MSLQLITEKANFSLYKHQEGSKNTERNNLMPTSGISTQQNPYAQSTINQQLQKSGASYMRKMKSKSLVSLNSSIVTKFRHPQFIRQQRYNDRQGQIHNNIQDLERLCEKYGGADFMKSEMEKNKISQKQQYAYYQSKIKSIHGTLSLPRIDRVRGQPILEYKPDIKKQEYPSNISKIINKYNKWFIAPTKRFTVDQIKQSYKDEKRVTKYVQKLLGTNNKNVILKSQNAPEIIKEWKSKLGRNPLFCSYAEIKRG